MLSFERDSCLLEQLKTLEHAIILMKSLITEMGQFSLRTGKGEIPFHLTSAQMDSIYPVVSEDVASVVNQYDTHGLQLFPAVIIGDDGKSHEEFYFFNFYRDIDCVDFQNSVVRNYSPAKRNNTILQYQLDKSVLDAIPEENRLMMKLAGVTGGALLFHEKVVKALAKFNIEAFQFFKLSDYRNGIEFE